MPKGKSDNMDILKEEESLLFGDKFAERQKLQTTQINSVAQNIRVEKDLKGMSKGQSPSSKTAKDLKIQPFRGASARGAQSGRGRGSSWSNQNSNHRGSFGGVFRGSGSGNRGSSNANRGGKAKFPCSPFSKKIIYSWYPSTPSWGKNRPIYKKLGNVNQRSRNSRHCPGMENTIIPGADTGQESSSNHIFSETEGSHIQRINKNAGKESHSSSKTPTGSVSFQHLHETKGRRRVQNNPEPKKVESENRILPLQDGRYKESKESAQAKRSDGQDRPSGCLLVHPSPPLITKVHEVQVGGDPIRVCSPSIRIGTGTANLLEVDEGADIDFEKVECESSSLLRRPPSNRKLNGGDTESQRLYYFPFAKPRFHNKPCQILFDSIAQMYLSRDANRQHPDDDKSSRREDDQVDLTLYGCNQNKDSL